MPDLLNNDPTHELGGALEAKIWVEGEPSPAALIETVEYDADGAMVTDPEGRPARDRLRATPRHDPRRPSRKSRPA
jgi:hypothetical protein